MEIALCGVWLCFSCEIPGSLKGTMSVFNTQGAEGAQWQMITHILIMEMYLGLSGGLCDHCLYVRCVVVLKEARTALSTRPIYTGLGRSILLSRDSGKALPSAVGKIQEPTCKFLV